MKDRPLIYAVDFDETLCFDGWPDPWKGTPNERLIKALIEIKERGHIIILWTCRQGELANKAKEYLELLGLNVDLVNENTDNVKEEMGDTRKILANYYIDDRAIRLFNNTDMVVEFLLNT